MRIRSSFLGAAFISALALFISYLKFARCIPGGWVSPDVYQKACYTDITALYEVRGFAVDLWPYGVGADSLEYPILSGIGIWLIALMTKNGPAGLSQFFSLNVAAIALTFLALVHQLYKADKRNALLFALSPAVISALFINWDIWAILPFIIALTSINQARYRLAGALLSISIFLKFFPVIYLIPILATFGKRLVILKADRTRFMGALFITTLIINVPFMVLQFDGWAKFYRFNFERGVDFGSIWYLISLEGSWISGVNRIITPLITILLSACYWRYRANLLGTLFMASVIFFTLNKVYSPQYVLWLTVIAVLYFPKTRIFYALFTIWQGGELLYQFGIWRHLLTVLDESGGITSDTYVAISAFRILTLAALAGYAIYLLEDDLIKGRRREANV